MMTREELETFIDDRQGKLAAIPEDDGEGRIRLKSQIFILKKVSCSSNTNIKR